MEMQAGDVCVVTGASGYLGSWLAKQLLEQGIQVRGTIRTLHDAERVATLRRLLPGVALMAADLTAADGWAQVMDGAQWVFHVASPQAVKSEHDRTGKALAGMGHVLGAACASPSVRKVVVTSSEAAIAYGHPRSKREFDEGDWTVLRQMKGNSDGVDYFRSKTLAEQLAWSMMRDPAQNPRGVALATVNPSLILGPSLVPWGRFSVEMLRTIISGKMPLVPDMGVHVIDVRDCAALHIALMNDAASSGRRQMAFATDSRMVDLARTVRENYADYGWQPSTRLAPGWLMGVMRHLSHEVASVASHLGNRLRYTPRHAPAVAYRYTTLEGIVGDTVTSMLEHGWIAAKGPLRASQRPV